MKIQKRFFFAAAIAVLGCSVLCSCSDDEEEDKNVVPKKDLVFVAPNVNWHCSIDDVRAYMKTMDGFAEDAEQQRKTDGTEYYFHNVDYSVCYSYLLGDDGLKESGVSYYLENNDEFESFKSQVSNTFSIEGWEEQPAFSGVEWWTAKLKGRKTDVSIGMSESPICYMYVVFSYTEFDW